MKSILILGAGIYQVPLIEKAQSMGYRTVVCSIPGNYPGFSIADKVYFEDTTDFKKCAQIAEKENVSGVCTSGTDVALISVGYICDKLKLSGITYKNALLSTNKCLMKEAFEKTNVPSPKYRICNTVEDAVNKSQELTFPIIAKVVDSSGSRGIEKIDSLNQVVKTCKEILQYTKKEYFVIEEYISGEEFGAQVFVQKGRLELCMLHGDIVSNNGKISVPVGHYVPYNLSQKEIEKINDIIEKIIKALGIYNSPLNIDFIKRGDEIYVLEVGSRAGATCLPELVSIHYGIDYYKYIILQAIGKPIDVKVKSARPCAAYLICSDKDGVLKEIKYTGLHSPMLFNLSFDYKKGDTIRQFVVGPDRIGQYMVQGESLPDILSYGKKVRDNIIIEIE